MRGAPVARAPLALLDDLFHRRQRRGEIGDRDQLRPAEQLRGGLGARGADEHGSLPAAGGQAAQPLGDAPVQVADGGELLAAGQRLTGLYRLARRRGRDEAFARPAKSMPSGRSRKRKCRSACSPNGSRSSCTPAGKYPDRCGKLGRPNTGAAPIAVIRLTPAPGAASPPPRSVERLAPPLDRLGLLGGQAIAAAVLEAELRVQVLAHDHVLELRGLGEQPPQVLPMRHDDLRARSWTHPRQIASVAFVGIGGM